MGRPGAGGGGSRTSGGRRMGQGGSSGSRPGSSKGPSGGPVGGGPRGPIGGGPRMAPPRHHGGPGHHHHHHHHHGGYGRGWYGGPGMPPPRPRRVYSGGGRDPLSTILAAFIVLVIIFAAVRIADNAPKKDREVSNNYSSEIKKEKLNTNNPFIEDCIKDELGWFDNAVATESKLKSFWEKTGVQPYILLRGYDANLKTDKDKDKWAMDFYNQNFETENVFLCVYFAEKDTDNDMGYMGYVSGKQASTVMDDDSANIFLDNLDRYWTSDLSTDDMFVKAFSDTADDIMN